MEYNLEWLQNNRQHILFECIYGSQAYGTATETSDTDIKGVYILPQDTIYGLDYIPEISDEKCNITYYEIGRFCELLLSSKTTVLEMLYVPDECVLKCDDMFKNKFIDNKHDFLTKDLVRSMIRMSRDQIRKATGTKKKMNFSEQQKTRKFILDFCFVPHKQGSIPLLTWLESNNMNQENCGLIKVPNMRDGYSLYHSTIHNYKGIMRKEIANDVCLSSIPKGETPLTFMQFNKDAYTIHCGEYREYLEWEKNSNKDRFIPIKGNENKRMNAKNMLHCVRVLQTLQELVDTGNYNVRRNNREELLSIKHGDVDLETILEASNKILETIDERVETSSLKNSTINTEIENMLVKTRKEYYEL